MKLKIKIPFIDLNKFVTFLLMKILCNLMKIQIKFGANQNYNFYFRFLTYGKLSS